VKGFEGVAGKVLVLGVGKGWEGAWRAFVVSEKDFYCFWDVFFVIRRANLLVA
jgi:hypothetical protein